MPPEIDPIEKKSYSRWLFVFGGLFFVVSVWAFYNEFLERRSWKGYQTTFKRLELKRLQDEFQSTKQSFDVEDKRRDQIPDAEAREEELSLRQIRLKIEKAEVAMEGREFKKGEKELKERKLRLEDAKQNYGFAKADQDEIFYEWKHALQNHPEEAEEAKKKYYELEERLKELQQKWDQEGAKVAEAAAVVSQYAENLKKWKKAEEKQLEPLARLKKKMGEVRKRGLDIQQVIIPDLGIGGEVQWGTVDRCQSCHVAISREGFENEKNPFKTHPHLKELIGLHPIEEFGCTTCHGGRGRATQIKNAPFEEGDFVHGIEKHWEKPLLRGDWNQATCFKCHQDQWKLDFAPVSMEGKKLFWNLGCTGCHTIQGFEAAPKVGPSLRRIASKVNEEWLVEWIREPKKYLPKTRMSQAPLDITEPGQIEKIAAYILSASEPFDFPSRYPGGSVAEGKRLFAEVGCFGCHAVEGKGSDLAPQLDRIAEKTSPDWIYNWIQNPKLYNPEAKMPRLRLTPSEAASITAYLVSLGKPLPEKADLRSSLRNPEKAKQGYLLISQYGCYGCHNIQGFEKASKLSVDLSTFGRKPIYELDFGDTKVPHNWRDWTFGKLKDPRMYLTEKTSSAMPQFHLTDEEIHALMVFLSGLKKEEVPERFVMSKVRPQQQKIDEGRRLVEKLNCRGCHTIEGEGRLIQSYLAETAAPPPQLEGIGARVRPEWMFAFLKDPSRKKVRPWIDVRMPTFDFTDEQANALIQYFSGLNGVRSDFYAPTVPPPMHPEVSQAGAQLISPQYFSCYSCHARNGVVPPGSPMQWGPDLVLVRERIRPEFLPEWIQDPQKFTPGVVMPAFLPSDDAAPPDILGGDRQKQAEAIRDYLLNLK